jgi:hypothetical protein
METKLDTSNDITVHLKNGQKIHGYKLVSSRFYPDKGWVGLISNVVPIRSIYKRFDIPVDSISFISSPIIDEYINE